MTRRHQGNGLAALAMAGALAFSAPPIRADDQAPPSPQKSDPQRSDPQRSEKTRGDGQGRAGDPTAHVPELRDETFRLMDAYLISNLQESLGLTDDQFTKTLPLVKKLQSDRRDFARRRMQCLRLLRKSLTSGSATEASVTDLLKELNSASADERAGTSKNLDALDAVLTPLQQAKYRVFEAEVDLRLRHLLARSQDRNRESKR